MPIHELAAICEHARAHGAWRIIDEIYLGLGYGNADGLAATTALSVDPDAIVINSFSKYFGMTGWRLGWCVVPPEMVPVLERLAQNYYICPSALAQYAALACFHPETIAICEARRKEYDHRRALVLDGLAAIGLPVAVPPDSAFFMYFNIAHTGLGAMEFCRRALEQVHVSLTPGNDFGQCGATEHVRLSYAASVADLQEGLARLDRFMAQFR